MTLWNIIRDFFVEFIFGGYNSEGIDFNNNVFGHFFYSENGRLNDFGIANSPIIKMDNLVNEDTGLNTTYLMLGDWLSTTATIITLIGICILLWCFVRWLFRLTSNLITLRG